MNRYLLFVVGLAASMSFGQQRCGMQAAMDRVLSNPALAPGYIQAQEQMDASMQNTTFSTQSPSVVITIPVVVHVLYKSAVQNISDAQIATQIAVLNADYRKLNADFSTVVPAVFQSFGADMELNFVLAARTPDEEPTTGIERKSVASGFDFYNNYYTSTGLPAWDPYSYLNIWVGKFDDALGLLGFAYLPSSNLPEFDGLCIDYRYFGTTGTATAPYNKGRTATHEIGHYFNLKHPWGNDGSACGSGNNSDGVADTPATSDPYYECPTFPDNTYACTTTANGSMFMNYMDYVNDACMAFFTTGQKTRVTAALNGPRVLLQSSLGATPLSLREIESKKLSIAPNPASDYFTITSTNPVEHLEIMNSLGQKVKEVSLNGNTNVSVQDLQSGVYFIRFYGEGQKYMKTKRLIKK